MRKLFAAIIFVLLLPSYGNAACGTDCTSNLASPATWTCTDISNTAASPCVQDAVTKAAAGDTILLDSGSATWTAALTIDKAITITGEGTGCPSACVDNTVITNGNIDYLIKVVPSNDSLATNDGAGPVIDISGLTLDGNGASGQSLMYVQNTHATLVWTNLKIHRNHLQNVASGQTALYTFGETFGVVYKNFFNLNNITTTNNGYDFNPRGNNATSWSKVPVSGLTGMGTKYFLYFEDNVSTTNGYIVDDSGWGSRWAYRYNTIDASTVDKIWDQHGNTVALSTIATEIHDNTVTNSVNHLMRVFQIWGGTTMFYNNSVQGSADANLYITIEHQYNDGTCDNHITGSYFWNNKNPTTGNLIGQWEDCPADGITADDNECIAKNTDYWTDVVECGRTADNTFTYDVSASRTTPDCTAGTSYWETDNKKLYRCTATNTWTAIYQPYGEYRTLTGRYYHPLRDDIPTQTRFSAKGAIIKY